MQRYLVSREFTSLAAPLSLSLAFHALILSLSPGFLFRSFGVGEIRPVQEKILRVRFPNIQDTERKHSLYPDGTLADIFDQKPGDTVPPTNTRFVSDKNRSVQQETQARITGPNPNSPVGSTLGSKPSWGQEGQGSLPGKVDLRLPGLSLDGSSAAIAPSNYLPQVALGNQTLLNTREYTYASFFLRMKRQMEATWRPQTILQREKLSRDQYVTGVQIVLEQNGHPHDVQISQPSGNGPLDLQALAAVRQAAPYLNPPPQLVESDGKIHIPLWNFIVTLRALF